MADQQPVVKKTLGNKLSHSAKAVAAFLTATVTLVTAILATVPQDAIPAGWALWIAVAVGYLTSFVVWLTANGPKIGQAIDAYSGSVVVFRKDAEQVIGKD